MQIVGAFDVGYVMQAERHIHYSPMSICSPVDSVPGRQEKQLPFLGVMIRLLLQPQIALIASLMCPRERAYGDEDLAAAAVFSATSE